jgi:hypothetical protein
MLSALAKMGGAMDTSAKASSPSRSSSYARLNGTHRSIGSSTRPFEAYHAIAHQEEDIHISGAAQSRIMPENITDGLSLSRLTISDDEGYKHLKSASIEHTALTETHRALYERERQIRGNMLAMNAEQAQPATFENMLEMNAEQARRAIFGNKPSPAEILATSVDAYHALLPHNRDGYIPPPARFYHPTLKMIRWHRNIKKETARPSGDSLATKPAPLPRSERGRAPGHSIDATPDMEEWHNDISEDCDGLPGTGWNVSSVSLPDNEEDEQDIDNMDVDELEAAWIEAMEREL